MTGRPMSLRDIAYGLAGLLLLGAMATTTMLGAAGFALAWLLNPWVAAALSVSHLAALSLGLCLRDRRRAVKTDEAGYLEVPADRRGDAAPQHPRCSREVLAMKPRPLTRQRSPWERVKISRLPGAPGFSVDVQARRVHDGTLRALVGVEPDGWHLSISFVNHKGEPTRYPTWDEIAHARQELLPATLGFVMHLSPADEYVAVHDTTFHLHQHPPRTSTGSPFATADEAVTGRHAPDPTGGEAP